MEYTLSERVKTLKPSAIREIFKYAADPSVVSLSAGNPAPEAFPVKQIAEISNKILTENPTAALQYSVTEGYPPLKKAIWEYMKKTYNIGTENDELLITSGAQQAMDLITKSTVNEGDTVICEAPSFIGSLNSFRSYNARLCGIPLENDGMNIECLENALKNEKNVRFIYIIANFQNPSGVTTSLQKRKKIYELASIRYENGSIPLIEYLDARRNLLSAKISFANANYAMANAIVEVIKAFGGGFEVDENLSKEIEEDSKTLDMSFRK